MKLLKKRLKGLLAIILTFACLIAFGIDSYADVLIKSGSDNSSYIGKIIVPGDNFDSDKMKEPAFMMVLCGVAPFAYRREDGVYVVPISCLKD